MNLQWYNRVIIYSVDVDLGDRESLNDNTRHVSVGVQRMWRSDRGMLGIGASVDASVTWYLVQNSHVIKRFLYGSISSFQNSQLCAGKNIVGESG